MRLRLFAVALFASLISTGAFAAPTATVTLPNATQHALLDTDVTFCVRFENNGNAVGYGPFIDLLLDRRGGTTAPLCDGLSYVSAKLVHTNPPLPLNAVATPQVATPCGPVTGMFTHPWGSPPLWTAGQEFVRIELPFGSFQNGQEGLDIEITAHVHPQADVGVPLKVQVRGGYRWGGPISAWSTVPQTVIPEVVIIEKTFLGADNEIASGPNFPGQYQIDIDVAPGQTITNAILQDCATNGVVFQSSGSNCFTQQWPVLAAGHHTIPAPFHIIEPPAVLPLACSRSIRNRAQLIGGLWTPNPPSNPPDPSINFASYTPRPTGSVTIEERTIAIQKRVTSGAPPVPGGTLGYQLDFQVSDYHRFGQIVVTDTLSDGQTLSGPINVSVRDRFGSKNVSLPATSACITVTKDVAQKYVCPPGKKEPCRAAGSPTIVAMTGGTRLTINISCIMKSSLLNNPFGNGVLTGGQVPLPTTSTIPATGKITFNVTINDQFSYPHSPGDPYIDKHDPILNAASISGVRASNTNLKNPPIVGPACTDYSYSCLSVPGDTLTKTVYAKNQTILTPPANPVGSPLPQFSVGDRITYRLSKTIPTGDAEEVKITDWFPLPLLQVPLLPPLTPCVGSQVVPPLPNTACYVAPGFVTTHTMTPVAPNALEFDFGTFNNTANTPALLEIYVTLTVSNAPRPDGLLLTNHARECELNTFGARFCQTAIAQFELTEPLLRIGKAVICPDPVCPQDNSTERGRLDAFMIDPTIKKTQWLCGLTSACPKFTGTIPGIATPLLASTTTNVDANDVVTFAVVVENHGNGPYGAHGVKIDDVLTGLPGTFVAGSLCVRYGDGTPVLYTPTTGAFPITLTQPLPPPSAGAGKNVVVLTFRVKMPPPSQAEIGKCLTNTATIVFYTNTPGGSNFVTSGLVDPGVATASACIRPKVLKKETAATSEGHTVETPVRPVAIGEIVRYRLSLDIPEGFTPSLTITDVLPNGLTYLPLPLPTYTYPGVSMPPPIVSSGGQTLTFTFGPIQNNNNSTECEYLTIEFPVLVNNDPLNVAGLTLANGFSATSTAGPLGTFAPTNNTKVTIVEPQITIAKSVTPATVGPGGSVSYTITLTSNGTTDAFDVVLNDPFPSVLTGLAAGAPTISPAGCATFSPPAFSGSTLTSKAPRMPPGCSATFIVTAHLLPGLCPPVTTNPADVTYSSLPGLKGTIVNPTGATVPGNPTAPDGERVYRRRASASFKCVGGCDFSIVKTAVKQQTAAGLLVTYTITVNVTPPGIDCPSCHPISIIDNLPPQLTALTVGPLPQYWTHTLVGSQLTLTTWKQPPPMPATFTVSGYVTAVPLPPTLTNCARINCVDGNAANNNSCVSVTLP